MPMLKKSISARKVPCGVWTYLFTVARLIVDSCIPMSLATSRKMSGLKVPSALFEEVALELEDRLRDFDDRALTLLDAVNKATWPIGAALARSRAPPCCPCLSSCPGSSG